MLEGQTAVITGASKGIGQAIAERFVEEGASVVLTARGKETLDETMDGDTNTTGRPCKVPAHSSAPS